MLKWHLLSFNYFATKIDSYVEYNNFLKLVKCWLYKRNCTVAIYKEWYDFFRSEMFVTVARTTV